MSHTIPKADQRQAYVDQVSTCHDGDCVLLAFNHFFENLILLLMISGKKKLTFTAFGGYLKNNDSLLLSFFALLVFFLLSYEPCNPALTHRCRISTKRVHKS